MFGGGVNMSLDFHALNEQVLAYSPQLPKRNYANNLEDAWQLKNIMPVRYLPSLPLHQYHDPKQLALVITLGYIRWCKENE